MNVFWPVVGTSRYVSLNTPQQRDHQIYRYEAEDADAGAPEPVTIPGSGSDSVSSPVVDGTETEMFYRRITSTAKDNGRVFRVTRIAIGIPWNDQGAVQMPPGFGVTAGWQPQWRSADGCRLYVTSVAAVPGVGMTAVRVLSRR